MNMRTPHRDALRIIFAIRAGAIPQSDAATPDVVAIFKGEARLLAFDFWIRNPDYFAAELVDLYVATDDQTYLEAAQSIFDTDEPDLRRVPMIRYLFGAYDRLDDALSLLRSRDLVRITGLKNNSKIRETDFLLTQKGETFCLDAVKQEPTLQWYASRADQIAKVAGDRGGAALKAQQYERVSYAETKLGGIIPSIASEIRQRLEELRKQKEAQ